MTAVLTTMMLPVLLGFAGLAVDGSFWLMERRNLQTSADAAALAAGYELAKGDAEQFADIARREAENNGLSADGTLDLAVSTNSEDVTRVTATVSEDVSLWFSQIFLNRITVSVSAVAQFDEAIIGSACILSLDETEDHALKTSGNVTVSMPNCGIAVNSDSDEALYMNGSVIVDVSDVNVTGDYATDGSVDFQYQSLCTGADPIADPYADLDVPSFPPCTAAQKRNGTRLNSSTTLSPGVFCGGITITGNNDITFEPGVYVLDGGSFDVAGQGSLYGEGVTFVLTNSASGGSNGVVDISGGRTVDFTAPEEGEEMEGVVFYQDRDAPENGENRIIGTANVRINGAAYFPSQSIEIGGNSTSSSEIDPCSRIIGRTVTLHGNPYISNACNGSAARNIDMPGSNTVKLVE